MAIAELLLTGKRPMVVGCFGSGEDLKNAVSATVREACEIAEVRLDLILDALTGRPWQHLRGIPLLFTARRGDEGGVGSLGAAERMRLLETVLEDAACVDIEVASIGEMSPIIGTVHERNLPWIASFHDFQKLPETDALEDAVRRARDAGASVFKAAARLHQPRDIARLAEFQLADHGIPVATMGMGPLAPVSRLLCAQCGSLLNYGFLGNTATAPGQWDAGLLQQAITRLVPFPSE